MRQITVAAILSIVLMPMALAADGEISVKRGAQVAAIGGCNDCHTVGYNESGGKVDPAVALKGNPVGFQGPWGTTYALNLRLTAIEKATNEDEFVTYLKAFETRPPMPWYNVHAMDESDLRFIAHIKSSAPGEQAPRPFPPGEKPKTPYNVLAPPIMP